MIETFILAVIGIVIFSYAYEETTKLGRRWKPNVRFGTGESFGLLFLSILLGGVFFILQALLLVLVGQLGSPVEYYGFLVKKDVLLPDIIVVLVTGFLAAVGIIRREAKKAE